MEFERSCRDLSRRENSWFLTSDYDQVKLYTKKEMKKALKTISFLEKTKELLESGEFTSEHYIYTVGKNDRKRELWTEAGLQRLKKEFLISYEEEKVWIEHFYFISESIGEVALAREVARRHNEKYPENPRKEKSIKSFMCSKWSDFTSKSRDELMLCFEQMSAIKESIEKGVDFGEKILKQVRYADMIM